MYLTMINSKRKKLNNEYYMNINFNPIGTVNNLEPFLYFIDFYGVLFIKRSRPK